MLARDDIRLAAHKLIARFERYAQRLREEDRRRQRREVGPLPPQTIYKPFWWEVAAGFHPYIVRAREATITHSVKAAITERRYQPHTPLLRQVVKADGGLRPISVFQIADSAVSDRVFRSLMDKNRARLSPRAFAYRQDLSLHDAIQCTTALAMKRRTKLLSQLGLPTPPPNGFSQKTLCRFTTHSGRTGQPVDARLPSIVRIGRVIATASAKWGTQVVGRTLKYGYEQPE